ncbi:hypothetical protein OIU74_007258 [Salix koriyanagi]|uniref:PGG domain-containing protein n=1 Tax=Salix koriyanagi TaxID=2511006 RepID=A0A9Q0Z669_9ROSI|nr:hypothetical protein OIU74_007258 [Salix koriyanagi]
MSQPSKTDNRRSASMLKTFQYNKSIHTTDDARNVWLVVVSLIAAVTFQAGVNPPGGVWQDGDHAGRAIYASQKKCRGAENDQNQKGGEKEDPQDGQAGQQA